LAPKIFLGNFNLFAKVIIKKVDNIIDNVYNLKIEALSDKKVA
jgi:hypothetical protein